MAAQLVGYAVHAGRLAAQTPHPLEILAGQNRLRVGVDPETRTGVPTYLWGQQSPAQLFDLFS